MRQSSNSSTTSWAVVDNMISELRGLFIVMVRKTNPVKLKPQLGIYMEVKKKKSHLLIIRHNKEL